MSVVKVRLQKKIKATIQLLDFLLIKKNMKKHEKNIDLYNCRIKSEEVIQREWFLQSNNYQDT